MKSIVRTIRTPEELNKILTVLSNVNTNAGPYSHGP